MEGDEGCRGVDADTGRAVTILEYSRFSAIIVGHSNCSRLAAKGSSYDVVECGECPRQKAQLSIVLLVSSTLV